MALADDWRSPRCELSAGSRTRHVGPTSSTYRRSVDVHRDPVELAPAVVRCTRPGHIGRRRSILRAMERIVGGSDGKEPGKAKAQE